MSPGAEPAARPVELAEGLHLFPVRTPTLPPATHTNAYVVGVAEFLVVEPASPYAEEQSALWSFVRGLLSRGAICRGILLTHHHPDHIGGLRALRERLEAPLLAHHETARRLGDLARFDRLLGEGDVLSLWAGPGRAERQVEVFHTPGHAPGHLCYVDRLTDFGLVGDMVAGVGTILIDPSDGDLCDYLDSLRRMERLGMKVLLPAHGEPLRDPQVVLRHYVAHRLMREAKVLSALERSGRPASLLQILPLAYDDTPESIYPLAARSLESHLRKLVHEGRVRRDESGLYAILPDR
jgi:glyoxylase-like metal-dependent hydrolase (beta-lactamase superfamily II)